MFSLKQIGITQENRECLELLKEYGYIDELQEGARFAASVALIKGLYKGKRLWEVGSGTTGGWNTVQIDDDSYLRNIVDLLGLSPGNLAHGVRGLIVLGCDYIYSRIKDKSVILVGDMIKNEIE